MEDYTLADVLELFNGLGNEVDDAHPAAPKISIAPDPQHGNVMQMRAVVPGVEGGVLGDYRITITPIQP